jgi:N-acetylneuraminate synthase
MQKQIIIVYDKGGKMYLIAEIGINHNGSEELAKAMIKSAADAGFDAVKFQKRTIDKCYTNAFLDSPRDSPWGTTQREQKMALEFTRAKYDFIHSYCRDVGIDWSASSWDIDSQDFIASYHCAFNKVASPMLSHKPLLHKIATEGKRTFISTGMSFLREIDEAVNIFTQANCPFELMHCNSTYPMPDDQANLLCIPMLRERYQCDVGYSGHETSLIKVCVAAAALGATSIERHITLDRAMYGSDQAASIETHHLKDFVEAVRAVPAILGNGVKMIADSEAPARAKLRQEVA